MIIDVSTSLKVQAMVFVNTVPKHTFGAFMLVIPEILQ